MEKVTKKSQLQVEALESFYSENRYPSRIDLECHAAAFGLTYKQVQCWFVEKRRREKRLRKATGIFSGRNGLEGGNTRVINHWPSSDEEDAPLSTYKQTSLLRKEMMKENHIQELFTPDHILKKVFRKDGPPLGVEFDSFPSAALCHSTESQGATKRRKVMDKHGVGKGSITGVPVTRHGVGKGSITGAPVMKHGAGKGSITGAPVKTYGAGKGSITGAPVKKHGVGKGFITGASLKKYGVGKGLMTVWRATNPDAGYFPGGRGFGNSEVASRSALPPSVSSRPPTRNRRLQQQRLAPKRGRLRNKLREKRKNFLERREVESNIDKNKKLPGKEKCELALEGKNPQEHLDKIAMLADDEELELRELQTRPNSLGCSDHCTTNGDHACSLCKDLLAKFPPNSVKMKQPFYMQTWDSSPEIVKKLFKVFHFLYTCAVMVDTSSFSIDEFVQAFLDKDSMLLGKIHVALLKLLLSNVKAELCCGSIPYLSKSCNFLAFMHSVENQESMLEFWKGSLNPLTWTEILRQVLVAAGFGSKQGAMRKDALSKEMSLMVKYGLCPGTLKGELFRVLLEQGINGLKVSELAKSLQITELNLSSGIDELESLICSTLSSDITLFEKISSSTYRVRINSFEKEVEEFQSDTEDSGGVDDLSDGGICSSDDDSGCTSGNSKIKKLTYMNHGKSKDSKLTVYTEIDESHPGEVWLLGLMEGEYSDLSMEEKLNALVALIDLLQAGSSFRVEDPTNNIAECTPSSLYSGSGAKIKRLSANQHRVPRPTWVHAGHMDGPKEDHSLKFQPIDSSTLISKFSQENFSTKGNHGKGKEAWFDIHPMQSVFLGSDRRYNRYWLFLGPCNASDPGHKRVYFESSEDGHWEMIDTEEALCGLLAVLDDRGKREALLIESLEKRIAFLCQAMSSRMVNSDRIDHLTQSDQSELENVSEDTYSPVSEVDNNSSGTANDSLPLSGAVVLEGRKKREEQKQKWSRIQVFDSWLWNSFYLDLNAVKHGKRSYFDTLIRCESCHDLYWRDEKHCKICHTTFELHFDLEERYAVHVATCREEDASDTFPKHKMLSSQIQSLKAATHAIESVMPEDALLGAWRKSAHKLWVKRLRRTSSLSELLQALADFVGAINEDRLYECNVVEGSCNFSEEIIASFARMPQTTSAVALWLVRLDALIAPYLERVHSERRQEISTRGRHTRKR